MEAIISSSPMFAAERRADCRYPIHTGVEYKLIVRRRVVRTGTGCLVNISRGGLLFECSHAIPPGLGIELEVDWPSHAVRMALHVVGQTLRSQGACTAVKILRSSFRGRHEDAGQGERPPMPAQRARRIQLASTTRLAPGCGAEDSPVRTRATTAKAAR